MRRTPTIAASLSLAVALGGCSLTPASTTSTPAKGPKKAIAAVISDFSNDASGGDAKSICADVLSDAVKRRLRKVGGCTKVITDQLATVSDYTLTIVAYHITGTTASVTVKGAASGKQRRYALHLVKQAKGGWRIDGLG